MSVDDAVRENKKCIARGDYAVISDEGIYCSLYNPTHQRRQIECSLIDKTLIYVEKGRAGISFKMPYWRCTLGDTSLTDRKVALQTLAERANYLKRNDL